VSGSWLHLECVFCRGESELGVARGLGLEGLDWVVFCVWQGMSSALVPLWIGCVCLVECVFLSRFCGVVWYVVVCGYGVVCGWVCSICVLGWVCVVVGQACLVCV